MNYKLYYAGFNNKTKEEQIGLVSSSDFLNWDYFGSEPIIPIGKEGESDSSQTSNPCVVKHNGVYKMWYQGRSIDGSISICYTESKDGLTWGDSSSVFALDENESIEYRGGFHHPHVIFDSVHQIYKMWLIYYKNNRTNLGYTESENGIKWKEIEITNLCSDSDNLKYWYPFVLKENNKYRMWFTKKNNRNWSIEYAESFDGVKWNFESNKPLIFSRLSWLYFVFESLAKIGLAIDVSIYGIGSPYVWKEDNIYYLIGHSVGPRGKLFISKYVSDDGLSWTKLKNNILPKPISAWNNFFQADPYLYVE